MMKNKIITLSYPIAGGELVDIKMILNQGECFKFPKIIEDYRFEYFIVGYSDTVERIKSGKMLMNPKLLHRSDTPIHINSLPNDVYFLQAYKSKKEAMGVIELMRGEDAPFTPKENLN